MDGAGSRLGRPSSRYGPTPVFTGPVRRWKKQWVHLSSSSSTTLSHHNATTFNGNGNGNGSGRAVRLPRWTPVSSSDAVKPEEPPPRRKLRYTPIAVLEEKKKNAAKGAVEEFRPSRTNQLFTSETTEDVEKRAVDITEETETSVRKGAAPKPLNSSRMVLDLSLNGDDGDNDSDAENN